MKENVLIAAVVKPYTVDIDGKEYLIDGEVWVGVLQDEVFKAAAFTKDNGRITLDGSSSIPKEEFLQRVVSWHEVFGEK